MKKLVMAAAIAASVASVSANAALEGSLTLSSNTGAVLTTTPAVTIDSGSLSISATGVISGSFDTSVYTLRVDIGPVLGLPTGLAFADIFNLGSNWSVAGTQLNSDGAGGWEGTFATMEVVQTNLNPTAADNNNPNPGEIYCVGAAQVCAPYLNPPVPTAISWAFDIDASGAGSIVFLSTDANGTTTQSMALTGVEVQAIPVPAAAWLFGSALVGLAGVARRRAA